ncbi:methyltransferase domain-containing protein [Pedococcus sp. KACC 23699]|uniref:Methyltransferase domain-containing protein n=1 Tax=Pedococcus sp. KACC 23699 TaxID=3149228 RepID=A0AAU7JXQ6_9MICO
MNSLMRRAVLAYSARNRKRKAAVIVQFIRENAITDAIFVGSGMGANPNEGIVEMAVAHEVSVRAACDIRYAATPWPFVVTDGRALPYADDCVDMVLSNAVIEHVGGRAEQETFVAEQSRVARSWVITTPNRWFPVESHTSAILRHWSPTWRSARPEFTRLLSRREFRELLPPGATVHGRPWSSTFIGFYTRDA